MIYKKPLEINIVEFTKAVISHRKRLLNSNKSSINKLKALKTIELLELNIYKNPTRKWALAFWKLHNDKIKYLIKHDDFEKHNKFNEISMLSKL